MNMPWFSATKKPPTALLAGLWPGLFVSAFRVPDFLHCIGVLPLQVGQTVGVWSSLGSLLSIAGLLLLIGPATVARFIVAVVVDPVDGMCRRWFRPEVNNKILETHQPPLADSNATAAVSRIFMVVGVKASLPHSAPRVPFWGFCHAMREVKFKPFFNARSACGSLSGVQTGLRCCFSTSAVADTVPESFCSRPSQGHDLERSESLPCQVEWCPSHKYRLSRLHEGSKC